jgi:hypothetical protein
LTALVRYAALSGQRFGFVFDQHPALELHAQRELETQIHLIAHDVQQQSNCRIVDRMFDTLFECGVREVELVFRRESFQHPLKRFGGVSLRLALTRAWMLPALVCSLAKRAQF